MKVIYSETGKYVLDCRILALVRHAVQRVGQLEKEAEWIPSLEIYLPYTRYASSLEARQGIQPTGQVIIKVKPDSDVDDSTPELPVRYFLGNMPKKGIKVDLGEYGHEGWRSLIDYNDLLKLPNVYFTNMFLTCILEPLQRILPLPNLEEVEKEHWNPLAENMLKEIDDRTKEENYNPETEYGQRAVRLKSATESYLSGKTGLENLIQSIQDDHDC